LASGCQVSRVDPLPDREIRVSGRPALPANEWVTISVVLTDQGARVLVNDRVVASDNTAKMRPFLVGAGRFSNYVGVSRSFADCFSGMIEEFAVFDQAPGPGAAASR